ncbi:MAG: hypothetical protein COA83_02245 [Methylophaga sp.]|nr:MAG: hypothetical protein COA83_02245 [Methylophaga sp.]
MTEISDNSSQTNTSYSPTVGERLRVAREAKKITIAEVVAQLRLTKDNIVYLESDQWDKLHGRPYARGYFSSYVNFLGLPHAEMLALFNMEYSSKEPSIDGFKRSENNDQGRAWFKSLLWLAIFVAGAWFGYQYWLEMQHQAQQTDTTDSVLPDTEDGNTFDDRFNASIVEPIPVIESEQIASTEPQETIAMSVVEAQAVELQTEEAEELVIGDLLNTDTPEAMENVELVQPEQQDTLVNAEDTILVTIEPEVFTETKMLVIAFSEDCWVEITDRNNKKLLHKTVLAGETIELSGQWPLQVLLGNATAVAVRYNDIDFDILPHIRANVARFSVGEISE